jgi:formylmethanofuran dehydrogenase subunit C
MQIDASNLHYRDLNQRIRQEIAAGEKRFDLLNVNGQRYIADGIRGDIEFDIHGVPGNDLGAFMDGPTIRVHGNAQDVVGNTMNSGRIIVHGHAGDVLGYGMRGGELLVRGDVGYRVGIHMKAFGERQPVVVAGGRAGDFLGEYMAGGLLIVLGLGLRPGQRLVGNWCATGMHGGSIYLRSPHAGSEVASGGFRRATSAKGPHAGSEVASGGLRRATSAKGPHAGSEVASGGFRRATSAGSPHAGSEVASAGGQRPTGQSELDSASVAGEFARAEPATGDDRDRIRPYLEAFCEAFALDLEPLLRGHFVRIAPLSHRPFGAKYAA